ncbi:MAG: cell wall hydrolase [Alphaproteobacteria bacterium]
MEPESGIKRRFVLAVVNVIAAVGFLGAIAYAFIFTQTEDRRPLLAVNTAIAVGGGKASFSIEPVRISNTQPGPPATTGSPGAGSADLRRIVISAQPLGLGKVRKAAIVPDFNTMLGSAIVLRGSADTGAARVVLASASGAANIGDGFASTPLFDRPSLRRTRASFGTTPAPAPVPLAARGNQGAVLTLAFAPSPFAVLDVTRQDRTDLARADEILHKRREEKVAQRNRRYARQRYCLAAAVYYEARGEPRTGQLAVAQVVLNRVNSPNYPSTICGVVFQNEQMRNRCQFSFACDGKPERPRPGRSWRVALKIASQFQNGKTYAPVKAATNYHADYVRPKWSKEMRRIRKIGRHIFYRT